MARMRARDRRRQLLEVAADLFAKYGYRGTTTARLAEQAGITEPILYRHFDNKQDLFVKLIDHVGQEVIDAWQETLSSIDDPDERLRTLLGANPATHARGRGVYRVIFQAMTELDSDDTEESRRIGKSIRKHLTKLHEFIEKELEQLQQRGAVRDDQSPTELAWLLINVAIGFGMVMPLNLRGQAEAMSKDGMQGLLRGMVTGV